MKGFEALNAARNLPPRPELSVSLVLIPEHSFPQKRPNDYVEVPVVVHVGGLHNNGALDLRRDPLGIAKGPVRPVFVPRHGIRPERGRKDVGTAVSRKVGGVHVHGPVLRCFEHGKRVEAPRIRLGIGHPSNGLSAQRGNRYVGAFPGERRRVYVLRPVGLLGDNLLDAVEGHAERHVGVGRVACRVSHHVPHASETGKFRRRLDAETR